MLRFSRAALYGGIAGAIIAAIGQLRAPDVPPGVDAWAYVIGGWTGCVVIGMAIFVTLAAIYNLIVDRS